MEPQNFKLISQNIDSSKQVERITDVLKSESPDLFLLQEITLSMEQLQAALEPFQNKCDINTNQENPCSPGTAAIW